MIKKIWFIIIKQVVINNSIYQDNQNNIISRNTINKNLTKKYLMKIKHKKKKVWFIESIQTLNNYNTSKINEKNSFSKNK